MRSPLRSPALTLTPLAPKTAESGGERRPPRRKPFLGAWGYLEVAAFVEGVGGSEDGNLPVVEVGLIHQGDPEALHGFLLKGFQLQHQGFLRTGHLLLGHLGGGGGGAGPGPQSSRTGGAGPSPSPRLALGPGRTGARSSHTQRARQGPRRPVGRPVSSHTTRAGPFSSHSGQMRGKG